MSVAEETVTTVSSGDLARVAGVRVEQIHRWVRSGRLRPLPATRRERDYVFLPEALEQARELGHAWRLLRSRFEK